MKAAFILSLVCLVSPALFAQSATVTWTQMYQTMDGWGGEDWVGSGTGYVFNSAQADLFFSQTAGIGLEYIVTQNYACPVTGACAVSTSNVPDLVTLQLAAARGAKISLIISPPANLKYSGNFANPTAGANGTCIPNSNWPAYATHVVQWIQMLNSNGAPVNVLAITNESNSATTDNLGGCDWTGAQLDSFIAGTLGPALTSAGLIGNGTYLGMSLASNNGWFNVTKDLWSGCLNDSACSSYIYAASAHGYGNQGSPDGFSPQTGYCCAAATDPGALVTSKHVWMSEINGGYTFVPAKGLWAWDPSISDAMVWARNIHDYLTVANVSAWNYWQLVDCCNWTKDLNDGLATSSFAVGKRYYVVGQWSKFIRSGWVRIDATPDPANGVYVTAFKEESSGNFAIVAINQNSSSVNLAISLVGFPSVTSVTPTLTSASVNLADQASVNLSGNGFSYQLPSSSVATFHGGSSSGSSQRPAAPANLAVSVR